MTSAPVRNPLADPLLTPQNAALLLIDCALWTEICMAFTALDALRDGYEVYPVVDAIGGTSPDAHRAGLDRVIQAGGQPGCVSSTI